ncbi:site-specific integrase [Sandarakinorhabdus sp. AAP62]|uniref:tyrosine-type recombinase/integrase n=1 Tax=Sandarakinorhabdus sp. AAP62 TaxID=1248916 RepID=UPI00031C6C4B|nr:site-specific integrase [Sandarakinorhabdus sp. AAP62]
MPKLTKKLVEGTAPIARDQFLWDEALKGFGLKVSPAGRRTYVFQYRVGGREARSRRFTIGVHGEPWTVEQARTEGRRLATMVDRGEDPLLEERRRRQDAVSLEIEAYVDAFTNRYLKIHWPSSWRDGAAVLKLHFVPGWKGYALSQVKRRDIALIMDRLADRPGAARLTFATLRRMFKWAVERGDLEHSPMVLMSGPATLKSRDRVLTDAELRAVWLAAEQMPMPFGPMYRLLILTGARREEVAAMDWQEIDLAAGVWTLPVARAKNNVAHIVPLSLPARQIIEALGPKRKGLVFSTTGKTAPSGFSKAKRRLDELALQQMKIEAANAGGDPDEVEMLQYRIHDLRRTLATGLQRLGTRFEVTEAVLNHVSGAKGGVAGIYQRHHWSDEKRAALDAWAVHVLGLMAPTPQGANVVPLRRRTL